MCSSSSRRRPFLLVGVTLLFLSGVPYLLRPGRGALLVNAAETSFEKVSKHFKLCQMGVFDRKYYDMFMQGQTGDPTWNSDDFKCLPYNLYNCYNHLNHSACLVKRASVKVPHCSNLQADPYEIVYALPQRAITAYMQRGAILWLFNKKSRITNATNCLEDYVHPELHPDNWIHLTDPRFPPEAKTILYEDSVVIKVKKPAPVWSYLLNLLLFLLCVALAVGNGKKWFGKTQGSASGHAAASNSQAAESWQTPGQEGSTGGLHSLTADNSASFQEQSSSMATPLPANQSAFGAVQQTPSEQTVGQLGPPTGMVSSSEPMNTSQPPLPTDDHLTLQEKPAGGETGSQNGSRPGSSSPSGARSRSRSRSPNGSKKTRQQQANLPANVSIASAGEGSVQQALPVQSLPEPQPQFHPPSYAPQPGVQAAPMTAAGNQPPAFAVPGHQTAYPPRGPPPGPGPSGFPPRSAGFPPRPAGYPPGPRGYH